MISTRIAEAPIAWNHLNGIINAFKPAEVSVRKLRSALLGNICKDLNHMKVRPPREKILVENNGDGTTEYSVKVVTDLADHVLSVGPRYEIPDIRFSLATHLGVRTSGVLLIGLNEGTKDVFHIRQNQLLRSYHVSGTFGTATENNFRDTKVVARSTYNHVWPDRIASLLASMQASHQKKMFELAGVDIQSQSAYDMAVRGLIRPATNEIPVIYGVRCIEFRRPNFLIELHAINESEEYILQLIQEIGVQLHSVAHCTGIRCVRYGQFNVDYSLLRKHWTLQGVLTNMTECRKLLRKYPNMRMQKKVNVSVD